MGSLGIDLFGIAHVKVGLIRVFKMYANSRNLRSELRTEFVQCGYVNKINITYQQRCWA